MEQHRRSQIDSYLAAVGIRHVYPRRWLAPREQQLRTQARAHHGDVGADADEEGAAMACGRSRRYIKVLRMRFALRNLACGSALTYVACAVPHTHTYNHRERFHTHRAQIKREPHQPKKHTHTRSTERFTYYAVRAGLRRARRHGSKHVRAMQAVDTPLHVRTRRYCTIWWCQRPSPGLHRLQPAWLAPR